VDKYTIRNISGEFNGLLNQWKGMPHCLLCGDILWYVYSKEDESFDPDKYWIVLGYYDVKIQRLAYTYVHRECFQKRCDDGHTSEEVQGERP